MKREHLISLIGHYDLDVNKSKRRAKLRDTLITHMDENDILSDDALQYISKEEKSEVLRIKEMELDHEKGMRLRQLEYERGQEKEKREHDRLILEYEKKQEKERREYEREQERENEIMKKSSRELEVMAAEKEKDRVMKVKLEQ